MENPYFEKSKINLNAATVLNKAALYAPSVHCSYYGIFQFMLHTCSTKTTSEWAQYLSQIKKDTHSHLTLIQFINKLLRKANPSDYKYFQEKITTLKRLRITADYSADFIQQEDAFGALSLAIALQRLLTENIK